MKQQSCVRVILSRCKNRLAEVRTLPRIVWVSPLFLWFLNFSLIPQRFLEYFICLPFSQIRTFWSLWFCKSSATMPGLKCFFLHWINIAAYGDKPALNKTLRVKPRQCLYENIIQERKAKTCFSQLLGTVCFFHDMSRNLKKIPDSKNMV